MPTKNLMIRTYESFSCIKESGGQESGGQAHEVNPKSWTQHLLFICEEEH